MDRTGRTCLECQAPLAPGTRFCTKCGRPAQPAAPGEGGLAGADWADRTVTQAPPPAFRAPGPPPAYDRPSWEPQEFEALRPHQPTAPADRPDGGQPPPGPPPWPPRQPPRRHDRNRSGPPLALWTVLLVFLLAGGATAGLLLTHPFSHQSPGAGPSTGTTPAGAGTSPAGPGQSASTSAAASPSTSASAPAVTGQQAAASVATMLSQSVSDRAAITTAYDDVLACDPAMASAPRVFDDAASSRQRLLASLAAMPGRAALPPALLSDLTQAWQASAAADQAFAQWAADELHGCTPNDTGSPAYQATVTPDVNATRYKTAFVALWNPIAARYNLTQYQQNQL